MSVLLEAKLLRQLVNSLNHGAVRLFRNTVGQAWVGKHTLQKGGTVLVQSARRTRYGLCAGSSDLIGWRTLRITPDMVGQRVAVFCAIEVKAPRGVASREQKAFIEAVTNAGGIAGIARSQEDAMTVLFPEVK